MLKITNNVFHALKVGFANEVGRLCDRLGIDSHRLMELVCADSKLNISPAYLRPGFAFGGSCLPKDLRFVSHNARRLGVQVPIMDSILPSNEIQISSVLAKLQDLGIKKVGVLGLSFKAGTDDLRESPIISLIRDLWQDGFDVLIHDPDVDPKEMLGSNLSYLERQLPQINFESHFWFRGCFATMKQLRLSFLPCVLFKKIHRKYLLDAKSLKYFLVNP